MSAFPRDGFPVFLSQRSALTFFIHPLSFHWLGGSCCFSHPYTLLIQITCVLSLDEDTRTGSPSSVRSTLCYESARWFSISKPICAREPPKIDYKVAKECSRLLVKLKAIWVGKLLAKLHNRVWCRGKWQVQWQVWRGTTRIEMMLTVEK